MPVGVLFVRRLPAAAAREARVDPSDLRALVEELRAVPGGLGESPVAEDAAELIEQALAGGDAAAASTEIPDGQAEAIHWALERMAADERQLSAGLRDLRAVVAP